MRNASLAATPIGHGPQARGYIAAICGIAFCGFHAFDVADAKQIIGKMPMPRRMKPGSR